MQGLSIGRLEIRVPVCKKTVIKKKPNKPENPREADPQS